MRSWMIALVVGFSAACTSASTSGVPTSAEATGGSGGENSHSQAATGGMASSAGGSGGAGGQPYQPTPIPAIDPEPPPGCPEQTPSGYFQFLDDTCGDKRLPSYQDRDLACPITHRSATTTLVGGGTVTYQSSDAPIVVDTDALAGLVPAGLDISVILIRRVDGVPHYRYLGAGNHDLPFQPWSTTKFLAAANAATYLRLESNYALGLAASVDGQQLGDLVTSMHNYDYAPFSSNGLGRYFHNIGGRDRANAMIHGGWLQRPAGETFGGNYGAAAPPLDYAFTDGGSSLSIQPDSSSGPANHLASVTTAEALKRLVLHREEPDQRLPAIQWQDVSTLLYGAEASSHYGAFGGMSADTAIYLQTGHDIDYLEQRSQGRWRVFSKLGLGTSGQFLNVGYACFPVLDDSQQPVPGWGSELVISAHLPSGGASWTERDRLLARSYRDILTQVLEGRL